MPSSWGFGSLQITETHDSDKISPHEFANKLISHAPITTTFLVEIGRRRSSRFILCVTLRGAHFTAFCPIPSQGRRGRTKLGNSGRGKGGNGFISGAWSRATKLHFFSLPFPYPEIVFCYRETAEQRPSRYYSFRHKLGTSEKYAFKTISSFNKTVEDRYRVLTGLDWPTHWRSRNRPFLAKLGPKVLEREHLCAIGSRRECTQPRYCTILWRQVHSSAISIVWPSHCCGVTYS